MRFNKSSENVDENKTKWTISGLKCQKSVLRTFGNSWLEEIVTLYFKILLIINFPVWFFILDGVKVIGVKRYNCRTKGRQFIFRWIADWEITECRNRITKFFFNCEHVMPKCYFCCWSVLSVLEQALWIKIFRCLKKSRIYFR